MLARLGSLVDVLATPAYTWMFGLAAFGAYVALWSAVAIAQTLLEAGLSSSIQRILPQREGDRARRIVGAALAMAVLPTMPTALVATIYADAIARALDLPTSVIADPATAIALFAWALPLWALLEVSTAILRSRRTFGAEIRLRIMWEQMLRLVFGFAAWFCGWGLVGLLIAHLASLSIASAASLRLVLDGGRPAMPRPRDFRDILFLGIPTVPLAIVGRAFIDLPPLVIAGSIPGPSGTAGAGLYAIARKLSSMLTLVKQIFSYVLAPIASAERRDPGVVREIHGFAARCSTFLTLPAWMVMATVGTTLLDAYAKNGRTAYPILLSLATARLVEALLGPSGTIQQVIGHPALALLNAAAGLSVFVIAVLLGDGGALGMALAVASGQITVALMAAVQVHGELRISLAPGLRGRMLAANGAGMGMVVVTALVTTGLTDWVACLIVVASAFFAAWVAARSSMPAGDRAVLGGLGSRLRIAPPGSVS